MIRTQISIGKEEYNLAKKEARTQGISLAEFFRRALRRALPVNRKKKWMRFAGMVESGNPRSSQEIDQVYDEKE